MGIGILESISIGINPNLFSAGGFILSWHGVFTFIAVVTAVVLVVRWARREGMDVDCVYSASMWAIIGGVIGARVLHVIDFWDEIYQHDIGRIFSVWSGGIAIFGAISGGFVGGSLYLLIRNSDWFLALWRPFSVVFGQPHKANLPRISHLADVTAPALLVAMAIGRIGDIINGEHCSRATDLLFGFQWVHSGTAARNCADGFANAVHPAIAYEMIWNILALAVIWQLRGRLKPDGMIWTLYLALYAIGRFGVTFFREDRIWTAGLQEAQIIALLILAITVPILLAKARFGERVEEAPLVVERGTRAERRRGGR
jgi:phosphatidylglycerol:prolipoprotein diacylglycerol transferase